LLKLINVSFMEGSFAWSVRWPAEVETVNFGGEALASKYLTLHSGIPRPPRTVPIDVLDSIYKTWLRGFQYMVFSDVLIQSSLCRKKV
jgi:hypothetical protein